MIVIVCIYIIVNKYFSHDICDGTYYDILVDMQAVEEGLSPYEKYLYQSIGAIYVPYMSPIISIGEL